MVTDAEDRLYHFDLLLADDDLTLADVVATATATVIVVVIVVLAAVAVQTVRVACSVGPMVVVLAPVQYRDHAAYAARQRYDHSYQDRGKHHGRGLPVFLQLPSAGHFV